MNSQYYIVSYIKGLKSMLIVKFICFMSKYIDFQKLIVLYWCSLILIASGIKSFNFNLFYFS